MNDMQRQAIWPWRSRKPSDLPEQGRILEVSPNKFDIFLDEKPQDPISRDTEPLNRRPFHGWAIAYKALLEEIRKRLEGYGTIMDVEVIYTDREGKTIKVDPTGTIETLWSSRRAIFPEVRIAKILQCIADTISPPYIDSGIKYGRDGKVYLMDVRDDRFVHFTTKKRAEEILEDGFLRVHSPYPGMGAEGVWAVSTIWGSYVPSVQISHLERHVAEEGPVVAILFSTDTHPEQWGDWEGTKTVPRHAHQEEVGWLSDVRLIDPRIISKGRAVSILRSTPHPVGEDEMVAYV